MQRSGLFARPVTGVWQLRQISVSEASDLDYIYPLVLGLNLYAPSTLTDLHPTGALSAAWSSLRV
jgi:hypothetical protein